MTSRLVRGLVLTLTLLSAPAFAESGGSPVDGPPPDGGTPLSDDDDNDGCGCSVGEPATISWATAGLAVLLIVLPRRRRS